MLKNDAKSIEMIAAKFSSQEISSFAAILQKLHQNELLSLKRSGYDKDLRCLKDAFRLQSERRVYVFHTTDTCGNEFGNDGVEAFMRHGDKLSELIQTGDRWSSLYQADEVAEKLIKNSITEVYTGNIGHELFLDYLPNRSQDDDGDVITRCALDLHEIDIFQEKGVKVIVLEILV